MNGLQLIELSEASFMDKVLRREPRENAFVEINNLLACVPILELDRGSIEKSLEKHDVSVEDSASRLLNFYSLVLSYFLNDLNLDEKELEQLRHLKYILMLNNSEVGTIHRNRVQPIYQKYVRQAVSDGLLTADEKETLEQMAERLCLPDKNAKDLYANEASKYLRSVLNQSLADGMLTDEEDEELERIANDLGVELKFTDDAKRNLERCRSLWRISQGEMPRVKTAINFGKKEYCSAYVDAVLYQVNNQKVPVKYSGYHEVKYQGDFGFHSGVLSRDKVPGKAIKFIDQGVLYFTNTRLYFNGINGVKNFPYRKLSGGTFYTNGLLVEHKRSRDQFFLFDGDKQALKLIFDALMTKSRK